MLVNANKFILIFAEAQHQLLNLIQFVFLPSQ